MNTISLVLLGACLTTAARLAAAAAPPGDAPAANLARNGSFELDTAAAGVPDAWATAGSAVVAQTLTLEPGREGGKAAKLDCTAFSGGSPSCHAMLCQVGVVGATKGQWYKLTCWAKARGIAHRQVSAALSNTKTWGDTGLRASFPVTGSWQRVERVFQATADVPAESSRLQFWFASTGTLWLDDVCFEPVTMRVEWQPQLIAGQGRNRLPNSSFECGTAGWGSYSPAIRSWGNVFRLCAEPDTTTAAHGHQSLRVQLTKGQAPTFFFDYYDPIQQELLTVAVAHLGWITARRGEEFVLSCMLKADHADVPGLLLVHESSGRDCRQEVKVGPDWQRFTWAFRAESEFFWTGVGLDLANSPLAAAALWVDAVQLEAGTTATDYAPYAPVEVCLDTPVLGNVFTDPSQGLTLRVSGANHTAGSQTVRGQLRITDFADQEVLTQAVEFEVAARSHGVKALTGLLADRTGYYGVAWEPQTGASPLPQRLRCAQVPAYRHADSPFGMNHAYPWDYLLRLSKNAGLTWMRDWSVKWQTIEPTAGAVSFAATDPQIDRVREQDLNVLLLFPFPSAAWSSAADLEAVKKKAGNSDYLSRRYVVACPARNEGDFRAYIRHSVRHYRQRIRCYQVMNEPVYTTYALPAEFGYKLGDYLQTLKAACETIKAEQPDAVVVGGMGTWAGTSWVRDFVAAGGLRYADVMDLHLYPAAVDPEVYEPDLVAIRREMRQRGEDKPMWLTEFGCYADDTPAKTPSVIGDSAMSNSNWPSERAAGEALVKTAAVFLANGVRKVFYHAGSCGPINGSSAEGVFFAYGGTPRRLYPALAVLADRLGPAPQPLDAPIAGDQARAYVFKVAEGRLLAVAWATTDSALAVALKPGIAAADVMGNRVTASPLALTGSPVYLAAASADVLLPLLRELAGSGQPR